MKICLLENAVIENILRDPEKYYGLVHWSKSDCAGNFYYLSDVEEMKKKN